MPGRQEWEPQAEHFEERIFGEDIKKAGVGGLLKESRQVRLLPGSQPEARQLPS